VFFLGWALLVFGQFDKPTHMSQWIYDAYGKKQNIAKDIKDKKILIVAGSNALFGIDSKILASAFGMRVLNYGVNAGIELPYTLHVAKRVINRGDIVVMPLEYGMYSYDGTAGEQMIDYIFAREGSFFWELSFYEQLYMLWHVDLKRIWAGYLSKGSYPIHTGLYGAHHIDENGDQINTALRYRKPYMDSGIRKHTLKPEKYGKFFDRNSLGWKYIASFVKWCKRRDVKVVFMPSTLMKHESYFKYPKEKWLYENIDNEVKDRGWLYVGKPYLYMYDKSNYFDTNFHLIDKARTTRTFQMVEDLKKVMKTEL